MATLLKWIKDRTDDVKEELQPVNKFKDAVVAQVNPGDGDRTFKTVMNSGNDYAPGRQKSAMRTLLHNKATDFAGDMIEGPVKFVNSGHLAGRQIAESVRNITALATHNNDALRESSNRIDDNYNRFAAPDSGLFKKGTAFKDAEEAKRGDLKSVATRIGANTLETAASVIPVAKGGTLLKPGMKMAPKMGVAAGEGAASAAANSAGRQLREDDNVEGKQLVTETALGAAAGPLIVAGAAGAKAAAKTVAPVARKASGQIERLPEAVARADERIFSKNGQPAPREVAQGGYIRIDRDTAPDLTPEQTQYIREYADMLKGIDSSARGGDLMPDGQGGYHRTSEHTPFYRNTFAEQGRKPLDSEWFNEARKQIEGGNAAYGASDEYAKLYGNQKPQETPPAQQISQEQRVQQVREILNKRKNVQHTVEPDTPLQPGFVEGRDLLTDPRVEAAKLQPASDPNFVDMSKAPTMERLPAVAKPNPALQGVAKHIDEMPEAGAQFEVGVRRGTDGEQVRVVESVKRNPHGGLEIRRSSPDMPIATSVDDVLKDTHLANSGKPVTGGTIKEIKADQRALLNEWLGSRTAAEIQGIKDAAIRELDALPPANHERLIHMLETDPTKWTDDLRPYADAFRKATDDLYDMAANNGINMNRVKAYVTHIFDEKTLPKSDNDAAQKLLNPFHYGNERALWKTYADAAEAGVKMRYKDPRKILAVYSAELHKTLADVSYIKRLKNEGVLLEAPSGSRPDLKEIVIPERVLGSMENPDEFSQLGNTLYTTPQHAKVINETLNPEADPSLSGQILAKTASAASRLQDVGLSGGIWGTPVNAFAIAQGVKEMTAGRLKSPLVSFARSMTNRQANKYFANNDQYIKEMLKEGVPFSSSYDIPTMSGFAGKMRDANGVGEKTGQIWDALVSDPTFKRFLPMMQVELFKDIRRQGIASGMSEAAAKKAAGKTVRNFYGLRDAVSSKTANKTIDDLMTTFMFAPKYRAAMLRMWGNTLRSIGNPAELSNRTNLRFAAGAVLTYGAMNALNYAINGTPMWNNPDGKEDKLLIPIEGGDRYMGVPFLSSVATMPRYIAKMGKHIVEGKGDEVQQDAAAFLSYMTRPVADIISNENFSGRKIVDEDDSAGEKAIKRSGHVVSSYLPTWVREGIKSVGDKLPEGAQDFLGVPEGGQPGYQTATNLLELPTRYYDPQYFKGQPEEFKGKPGVNDKTAMTIEDIEKQDKAQRKELDEMFSDEDNAIRRLNDDQRERLIDEGVLTEDKLRGLAKYELAKRRELGMKPTDAGQTIPKEAKKLSSDVQNFYKDRAYVHDDDIEDWRRQEVGDKSKPLVDRANSMLPDNLPKLPATNEVAELYADFNKKRLTSKWSSLQENEEKGKFLKAAYKSQLDDEAKFVNRLSSAKLVDGIENGQISKELMDRIVAIDDTLVQMGFTPDIPKTVRSKYGYSTASFGSGNGGSGKGRGGKSGGKNKVSVEAIAKSLKMPETGRVRQATIAVKTPQAPSFKVSRRPKQPRSTETNKNIKKLLNTRKLA